MPLDEPEQTTEDFEIMTKPRIAWSEIEVKILEELGPGKPSITYKEYCEICENRHLPKRNYEQFRRKISRMKNQKFK